MPSLFHLIHTWWYTTWIYLWKTKSHFTRSIKTRPMPKRRNPVEVTSDLDPIEEIIIQTYINPVTVQIAHMRMHGWSSPIGHECNAISSRTQDQKTPICVVHVLNKSKHTFASLNGNLIFQNQAMLSHSLKIIQTKGYSYQTWKTG